MHTLLSIIVMGLAVFVCQGCTRYGFADYRDGSTPKDGPVVDGARDGHRLEGPIGPDGRIGSDGTLSPDVSDSGLPDRAALVDGPVPMDLPRLEGSAPEGMSINPGIAGLIAYYPMDDGCASGIIRDVESGARHGTCTGSECPTSTVGRYGGACAFDGQTQFVRLPGGLFSQYGAYTVSFWMVFDGPPSGTVISKYSGSRLLSWAVVLTSSEVIFASQGFRYPEDRFMARGVWRHVAIVIEAGGRGRFHFEGTSLGTIFETDGVADVLIGADASDQSAPLFSGRIDDLRVYDVALTDVQIEAIRNL